MGFLESLEPGHMRGGIYWCYRQEDGRPGERIRRLVAKHRGKLVPIVGFDEFMLQMGERMDYELLDGKITQQAKNRSDRYREQFEYFQKNLIQSNGTSQEDDTVRPVREALAKAVQREKNWWGWELKAKAESDPEKKERIYRQGLEEFPNSAELTGNFANFMKNIRKDYNEAERRYRCALELDPKNANHTGNFASFMADIRKDYDEAERLYRRALELDPKSANHTGNFAGFLLTRHRLDEAKDYLARAWTLNGGEPNQSSGELALYWCLIAKIEGKNDLPGIGRLKDLLDRGFIRSVWSFDSVLAVAKEALSEPDWKFYNVLAEAILDTEKVAELELFDQWKQVTPIPVEEPWEME